jgi:thymidylate kinase
MRREHKSNKRSRGGCLISVEGATGSGKSTLVSTVVDLLEEQHGITALKIGGFDKKHQSTVPPITKFLQEMMKASRFIGLPWLPETTILLAEQAYNVETYVLQAYRQGRLVLYENYSDALVAYQLMRGSTLGISRSRLLQILDALVNLQYAPFDYPKPRLTIYLTSPLAVTCKRLLRRDGKPVTRKDRALIKSVMTNYEWLYREKPNVLRIENAEDTDMKRQAIRVVGRIVAARKR